MLYVICVHKYTLHLLEKKAVTFDENFWQQTLSRIEFFVRRAVAPELFTRRVQRCEKLYQHGG